MRNGGRGVDWLGKTLGQRQQQKITSALRREWQHSGNWKQYHLQLPYPICCYKATLCGYPISTQGLLPCWIYHQFFGFWNEERFDLGYRYRNPLSPEISHLGRDWHCRQVASPQRRFISRTYVGPHKMKENCLKPRRDGMGMGSSRYDVLEKGDEGSRSSSTLRTNSIVFADRVGGGVQKMKIIARDVYGWTLGEATDFTTATEETSVCRTCVQRWRVRRTNK